MKHNPSEARRDGSPDYSVFTPSTDSENPTAADEDERAKLLTATQTKYCTVLRIESECLDRKAARTLWVEAKPWVHENSLLVVDLSSIEYCDCFAFETLLQFVAECPGKVLFAAPSDSLDAMFSLAQLDYVIHRYPSVDEAVMECQSTTQPKRARTA